MAVIAMSSIDLKKRRARLSQSAAKGNRPARNFWATCTTIHEAQIAVIISHVRQGRFRLWCGCAGRNRRSFAMSQLSGIVCLFLIAAAFLTSCDNQQSPPKAMAPLQISK
ncbi:hypothetical protein NKH57_12890 [Mesorhizobium sp. M1050]|nr:hypothetical protein [Mesorhizobium sp. LNHC252B00]